MASITDPLVKQFLEKPYIAALASQNPDGSTHMVAVWFWFDGTNIFVATASRSRKARNLKANSKVSLMIDSRGSSRLLWHHHHRHGEIPDRRYFTKEEPRDSQKVPEPRRDRGSKGRTGLRRVGRCHDSNLSGFCDLMGYARSRPPGLRPGI